MHMSEGDFSHSSSQGFRTNLMSDQTAVFLLHRPMFPRNKYQTVKPEVMTVHNTDLLRMQLRYPSAPSDTVMGPEKQSSDQGSC